jgi:hypothetical protein
MRSSLAASAAKARMPSASFSVAMASSFSAQRKAFSSRLHLLQRRPRAHAAGPARASSGASLACSAASSSGLMVSRSQPASAVICPTLRKLAPMTSVAMPKRL